MGTDKCYGIRCACGGDAEREHGPIGSVSTVGHDTAQEIAAFVEERRRGATADPCARNSVVAEAMLADAVRVEAPRPALPTDSSVRKRTPLCTGVIDYFDSALALLAAAEPLDPNVDWDHETHILEALRCRGENGMHEYVTIMQHALAILHRELSGDPPPRYRTGLGGLFEVYAAELYEVAQGSWFGNEKHNPGQPLHHSRGKSADHADCIARHAIDNALDPGGYEGVRRADGSLIGEVRHAVWLVWRSFALTQEALEAEGAPKARGAKLTRPRCMLGCDPDRCPGPASGHYVFGFHHYQDDVARTSKHPDAGADLVINDALGIAGEAGEVVELIKKARFHGLPLDADRLKSEIGDVLWYLTDLCAQAGFTLADAAQSNVEKLRARYPNGFVEGGGVR